MTQAPIRTATPTRPSCPSRYPVELVIPSQYADYADARGSLLGPARGLIREIGVYPRPDSTLFESGTAQIHKRTLRDGARVSSAANKTSVLSVYGIRAMMARCLHFSGLKDDEQHADKLLNPSKRLKDAETGCSPSGG